MKFLFFARWFVFFVSIALIGNCLCAVYHNTNWAIWCVAVVGALMAEGALSDAACKWLVAFLLIVAVCALIIVFPLQTLALVAAVAILTVWGFLLAS